MSDDFDVLVVGSGQHSLTLGNYLARSGLKVQVLERRLEAGGGVSTEELDVHGFWHNTGSAIIDGLDLVPLYEDLNLKDHYADYVVPPVQSSLVTRDGRSVSVHADLARTVASIAMLSRKDAETWKRVVETVEPSLRSIYALKVPTNEPPQGSSAGDKLVAELAALSPKGAVEKMFESPLVQALVLHHVLAPRMVLPDYQGMGWVVPLAIVEASKARLFTGGQHELIQALWNAFIRNGGDVSDTSEVTRIRVENGKAVGVELAGGKTINARAVVSNVDLQTTFGQLLEPSAVSAGTKKAVDNFKLDEFSIFAVHLALREPPKYKVGGDVNQSYRVNLGLESPANFDALVADIRAGKKPSKLALMAQASSPFDATQAHPKRHVALAWQFVSTGIANDAGYRDHLIEQWREYAPNLTKDNILLQKSIAPIDFSRKWHNMRNGALSGGRMSVDQIWNNRPTPELSGFKTPIENLYLCGGFMSPGLGLFGAAGYVAAGVIAKDLGAKIWWRN